VESAMRIGISDAVGTMPAISERTFSSFCDDLPAMANLTVY
jgi:hypothetical protein